MARTTWTTAVILVGSLFVSSVSFAEMQGKGPRVPRLVSFAASPSTGRQEVMFTVPLRSRLLVTHACVEHSAMAISVGEHEDRLTYGDLGCTNFEPGFVVAGGESLYCDNGSGLARTCALVGILEDVPAPEGQRVRFYDLRKR